MNNSIHRLEDAKAKRYFRKTTASVKNCKTAGKGAHLFYTCQLLTDFNDLKQLNLFYT